MAVYVMLGLKQEPAIKDHWIRGEKKHLTEEQKLYINALYYNSAIATTLS
jgi:hypothetical protein